MYTGNKDVFNRNGEARRSKKRQELRNLTKMTDEQLEGWAIMFGRNPRKDAIAQKYEFSGQQTELEGADPVDKRRGGRLPFVDRNTSSSPQPRQQQQQQQQQQKQQPGSGGGKSSQGPKKPQQPRQQQSGPSPQQTQQQQQKQQTQAPKTAPSERDKAKNERQKSSKANHNRRNAHAKKMATMNP
ncbi:hypothetical protein EC957_010904 [Mortierella hygrophila]|uniref:Uncharacterized protein n=1 Tax=Mortierella hygrophila TaxID=979708 RepID=A0A9P6F8I0_9FUNG|nr:hypothetical protein EC957_010904 [Mortierella hygrophila]